MVDTQFETEKDLCYKHLRMFSFVVNEDMLKSIAVPGQCRYLPISKVSLVLLVLIPSQIISKDVVFLYFNTEHQTIYHTGL